MPKRSRFAQIVLVALLLTFVTSGTFAQESSDETNSLEPKIYPGAPCPSSVLDLDRLLSLLRSSDAGERWGAAECLGEMKDARAVEPLVRRILDGDVPRLAMIDANALREINDPRAGELLIAALKEKKTRFQAAEAVKYLRDGRAVVPLIDLLRSSDKDDRVEAAEVLGHFKDDRATLPLIVALKDRNEVVRRFAASSLGIVGDKRAVEPLCLALSDADDGVRWNATNSLGDLKDSRAVVPLSGALTDDEENVRKAAADALGKVRDRQAVPALIASFKAGNRWHTAAALAAITDDRATEFLNAGLKQRQIDVVAAAHTFFIAKGDFTSEAALLEALKEYGRWEMAQNFMYCGNPKLENAGREWAFNHDYENLDSPETRVTWGSNK